MTARGWLALAGALVLCAGLAPAHAARGYPSRPVTIVVPYPPGGSNDLFARELARQLSDAWKVPVAVDNRPGPGSSGGAVLVSRSVPDGYTLCLLSSSFVTRAGIQPHLPYDPIAGFTPVAMVAKGPLLLTVANALPVKTTLELFDYARRNPGRLKFGSSGVGSINHLATELLMDAAQVSMTHVPYKGIRPAVSEVIRGRIDVLLASAPSVHAQVRAGTLRALGVTSEEPSPLLPGLRPLAQMGVPGYHAELWWGILGPPALPPEVARAINAEVNRIIATPANRTLFAREGAEPAFASPEQFAALIATEIQRWRQVARQAGIRAE